MGVRRRADICALDLHCLWQACGPYVTNVAETALDEFKLHEGQLCADLQNYLIDFPNVFVNLHDELVCYDPIDVRKATLISPQRPVTAMEEPDYFCSLCDVS